MVRWVVGSILHGVDPLSYFLFQPVLHDWCNKGCGMCYPVCGMVHIKEPLLLIGKSSLCGGSGFSFSLSEWSLTICLTPYNRKEKAGKFGDSRCRLALPTDLSHCAGRGCRCPPDRCPSRWGRRPLSRLV